jgi:hypothetical protein
MMGGKLRFAGIVLGCCLATALPGCISHRSGGGNDGWLAQRNYFSWSGPKSPAAKESTASQDGNSRSVAEVKPELLPWRSRLRGYHLGARFAHGHEQPLEESMADSSTSPSRSKLTTAKASEDTPTAALPTPSLENGELQLPATVGSRPERSRPDIVVE